MRFSLTSREYERLWGVAAVVEGQRALCNAWTLRLAGGCRCGSGCLRRSQLGRGADWERRRCRLEVLGGSPAAQASPLSLPFHVLAATPTIGRPLRRTGRGRAKEAGSDTVGQSDGGRCIRAGAAGQTMATRECRLSFNMISGLYMNMLGRHTTLGCPPCAVISQTYTCGPEHAAQRRRQRRQTPWMTMAPDACVASIWLIGLGGVVPRLHASTYMANIRQFTLSHRISAA
jgi:hypothetical protein